MIYEGMMTHAFGSSFEQFDELMLMTSTPMLEADEETIETW